MGKCFPLGKPDTVNPLSIPVSLMSLDLMKWTLIFISSDVYTMLGEELGRGSHSRVATCRHRSTGKEFAVKVIPKSRDDVREKVLREVEILYLCRTNR